jgi:bis(5'-nucleosyl)-tetraphosphatase (symmetrical)
MSTYVFGDIQGCYREMMQLLEDVSYNPETDQLWFVGDLVNRGPDNVATMQFILDNRSNITFVLGNHDLHFLAVASGCHKLSRHDTFQDLLAAENLTEIIQCLRNAPLLHFDRSRNIAMVHAGIHPRWSIEQAMARAREVEATLRGDNYRVFLAKMYGNKPSRWKEDLKGIKRLRAITNYFTRMRYCKKGGRLDLNNKTLIAPKGFKPWFKHDRPEHENLVILFGHWASLAGKTGKVTNVHALDTGCVWGRKLTLLRLDDMQRFTCKSMA